MSYKIGNLVHNGNTVKPILKIQQMANKFIKTTFELHHKASVANIVQDNSIMTINQIIFLFFYFLSLYLSS